LLRRTGRILRGLDVRAEATAHNLARYGVFAATERLLMETVRAGADRQAMHERIREHAMAAWQAVWHGKPNPLCDRLASDAAILEYLEEEEVRDLLDASTHIGDVPDRARALAAAIRGHLS
jgi:adenylosuccinate lyase